jgi:putative ABC transport system permease protein
MRNVLQDLRFGLRVLRKNPGFTAVAVLTLALGIGANTAIFSVVNSVVLAPLPFPGHERLVTLWFRANQLGRFAMTEGHFAFLRTEKQSFENLAAYSTTFFTLTGEGEADRLRGAIVSHEFLPTLGVEPLAPVLRASRLSLLEALKEGARGSSLSFAAGRAHGLLVAGQFALSLVLLAGAGLLLKSFGLLLRVDPGFRPQSVLALQISLPGSTYPEPERVRRFYTDLRERVGRLPGVEAAGLVGITPFSQQQNQDSFTVEGRESEYRQSPSIAGLRPVSGTYFEALGIPLIDGRTFSETDQADAAPVTIISESMARQYWPGGAVGRRVKRGRPDNADGPWLTIVGVVGDVKEQALDGEAQFLLYYPHAQFSWNSMALVARTRNEPAALVAAVREQVRQLDAQVPIYQVRTMQEAIDSSLKQRRFSTFLIGLFAAVALALSAVGIYGTMALNVGSRLREIAIRMAIGADRRTLLRMVLTRGLRLAFVGLGLGLVAAFGLTRLLSGFLYGVSPLDPQVFVLASLVLVLTGTVACYLPAYRATRVDPMLALRYE